MITPTGSATTSVLPGSATYNNRTFTIHSSGWDVWGAYDYVNYLSEYVIGNFTITAQVVSQTDTNPSAKAGLMIRQTVDADSPYVCIAQTPANVNLQTPTAVAGSTNYNFAVDTIDVIAPSREQVTRVGNGFTTSVSPDGVN